MGGAGGRSPRGREGTSARTLLRKGRKEVTDRGRLENGQQSLLVHGEVVERANRALGQLRVVVSSTMAGLLLEHTKTPRIKSMCVLGS